MPTRKPSSSETIVVRVPLSIRRRAGRKIVVAPGGAKTEMPKRPVESALIKAIARAFRWRDMLEDGTYATINEIAEVEKINETYVGRVFRLTLLAPSIVEAILDGRNSQLGLDRLMKGFPIGWEAQVSSITDQRQQSI